MATVLAVVTALLITLIAIEYSRPMIAEWLRCRGVVGRSAIEQEMKAMRAAQQLSLMAWRARHELHAIARDELRNRAGYPARRH